MTFPMGLPSADHQWHAKVVDISTRQDWNFFDSQGLTVLGEDLYYWTFRSYWPDSDNAIETEHLQLYRFHETLGWERLSNNNRGVDGFIEGGYDPEPLWSTNSGNLAVNGIYWSVNNCWVEAGNGFLWARSGSRIYRIDPVSLDWQVVAGNLNYYEYAPDPIDAPTGTNARLPGDISRRGAVHDGWLYWVESDRTILIGQTYTNRGWMMVRRMSLTAPHAVETLYRASITPVPQDFQYLRAINPATGLPYACDLGKQVDQAEISGLVFHGNDLYLLRWNLAPQEAGNTYGVWTVNLFRVPNLDFGAAELLYYALHHQATNPPFGLYPRDLTTEYSSVAPFINSGEVAGVQVGYEVPNYPGTGTPDLEGFLAQGSSLAVDASGRLFFLNNSLGAGLFSWSGSVLCKFDLDQLVADVQANGSIRHNREAPYYQTIANGTSGDEGWANWHWNNRRREFGFRVGAAPLIPIAALASLASGPDSVRWSDGCVMLMAINNDSFGTAYNAGGDYGTTQVVVEFHDVEESSTSAIELHLKFDGVELKGYSGYQEIERVPPPEEVTLS